MTDGKKEPDTCSAPYRVRFDEAGPDGLIRTSVLLRYTQDLASFHSTARGFGRAWYAEQGLTWLVRTAELAVVEAIPVGAELNGTTWVVGGRRVWARRLTEFHDTTGALAARVLIDWVLLDAGMSPTRIPPVFDVVFGAPPTELKLGRVDLGAAPPHSARLPFIVRPQELDPMDHVNNAVYADWLDEAVIATGAASAARAVPRVVRLEYLRSAEPSEALIGTTWRDAGGWSFQLAAATGPERLRARLEPGRPS